MTDVAAPAETLEVAAEEVADVSLLADAATETVVEGEKPADDAKPDAEAKPEGEEDKPAEPDATPFEGLKAPEGFAALDDDLLTAATPLMRAQGIDTPEKAQAFVDAFAPVLAQATEKAVNAAAEAQSAGISAQVKDWVDASKADPEFGGAKFTENLTHAAKARDRFFTTDAQKALIKEAPIFNHPEVIRAFVAIGKSLAEDSIHITDHSAQPAKTPGQRMYGDMKPVDAAT